MDFFGRGPRLANSRYLCLRSLTLKVQEIAICLLSEAEVRVFGWAIPSPASKLTIDSQSWHQPLHIKPRLSAAAFNLPGLHFILPTMCFSDTGELVTMCTIYVYHYACGHTAREEVPCAASKAGGCGKKTTKEKHYTEPCSSCGGLYVCP